MTDDKKPKHTSALDALIAVRHALQYANDNPGGGITDTLWMIESPQTVFDFLDAAIAAQDKKPEPVAWRDEYGHIHALSVKGRTPGSDNWQALYAAPPAREWVGLTDGELAEMHHLDQFGLFCDADEFHDIARAIEAALRVKNT